MNKNVLYIGVIVGLLTLFGVVGYMLYQRSTEQSATNSLSGDVTGENNLTTTSQVLLYRNDKYGFGVTLPESWRGYSVSEQSMGSYVEVRIKHPQSTSQNPRMDIPVLVVPLATWGKWYPPAPGAVQHPFAAPVPATERARNNRYVFATAPRYNYSFATGYEEVDEIVKRITPFGSVGTSNINTVPNTQNTAPDQVAPLFEEGEVKG